MHPIGWHDLATATQGRLVPTNAWGRCTQISTDSRSLQRGDVFWALPGEQHNGHDFAIQAVNSGAALVVCQADRAKEIPGPKIVVPDTLAAFGRLAHWHRRRHETLIIGVTGSVGKTTTKELIHAALSRQFRGLRSPGNYNNLIGLPKSLLALTVDDEFAVFELGASREGDIRTLSAIAEPEVGVITAIGKAHLASFGSVERIIRGKGELLEALPPTGFAVLPGDDAVTRQMASRAKCRVLFVGQQSHNDVHARDVRSTATEASFSVDGQRFNVALPGLALLTNALCAIAIARDIGVPLDLIADGLEDFQPLPGRGTVQIIGSWTVIDDCYNASPTSVEAACRRLATFPTPPRGRRYAVLGDMRELGPDAAAEHQRLGGLLAGFPVDGLLAFGQHARDFADGALRGGWRPGKIVATESLDVLLTVLDCWLEPHDTLLVKGSRVMQLERVLEWLRGRAEHEGQLELRRSA